MSKAEETEPKKKKTRLSQTDVPGYSLEQALRIARTLHENYAAKETSPLRVASAMNVQPGSGPFRQLCGSSIAYELTEGGYNASEIKLTPLGKRIVRPTKEGDDLAAKREALMKPRVIREFLTQYNGSPIPKDTIAQNVLGDMGVPDDRTSEVLALIVESAEALGLITEIKGKRYVDLAGVDPSTTNNNETNGDEGDTSGAEMAEAGDISDDLGLDSDANPDVGAQPARPVDTQKNRRVFITHGKNKKFVDPIKKLLSFGEMEAVVSVEKQSVSQPVPDKVMNDMRSCGAAIIHVEDELSLIDNEAKEHVVLNPNVLIEIGAAMALYGKRFILLVKSGVKLPSNLQGLYEVRYEGENLDGNATIQLLEAINEMKKIGASE
ncbi:TIR domain-containing protein [Halopseudomonas pachastrellae]|uniref:TIR domain-containing protein n=1 Tax=Halopseudomonas pachastrellae TaxID=254161 RepID=UPI003D7E9F4C